MYVNDVGGIRQCYGSRCKSEKLETKSSISTDNIMMALSTACLAALRLIASWRTQPLARRKVNQSIDAKVVGEHGDFSNTETIFNTYIDNRKFVLF